VCRRFESCRGHRQVRRSDVKSRHLCLTMASVPVSHSRTPASAPGRQWPRYLCLTNSTALVPKGVITCAHPSQGGRHAAGGSFDGEQRSDAVREVLDGASVKDTAIGSQTRQRSVRPHLSQQRATSWTRPCAASLAPTPTKPSVTTKRSSRQWPAASFPQPPLRGRWPPSCKLCRGESFSVKSLEGL